MKRLDFIPIICSYQTSFYKLRWFLDWHLLHSRELSISLQPSQLFKQSLILKQCIRLQFFPSTFLRFSFQSHFAGQFPMFHWSPCRFHSPKCTCWKTWHPRFISMLLWLLHRLGTFFLHRFEEFAITALNLSKEEDLP